MASLDSLPPDQRAVLQLVLQRGRTYDDIAKLLSIDRANVRERALQALDAIGPQTRVPADQRALITDYLLAQLSPLDADDVHTRLGESASERAWARVVASELQPLATKGLPDIPADAGAGGRRRGRCARPGALRAACRGANRRRRRGRRSTSASRASGAANVSRSGARASGWAVRVTATASAGRAPAARCC